MPAQTSLFTQSMNDAMNATGVVHCKQEPYDVYIGRPGNWGNPFHLESEADRQDVIERFSQWGENQPWLRYAAQTELKGKTLGCWCSPKACHGQVLADWAEGDLIWVFVFGSNLAGRHGKGAAAHAVRWHGARHGMGQGLQAGGMSWALPTKDARLEPLPLFSIEYHLGELFDAARDTPNTHYQLTKVGTGLAGLSQEDLVKAVENAGPVPDNVHLPGLWQSAMDESAWPRIIVAGSRTLADEDLVKRTLDKVYRRFEGKFVIVSGGAKGADWFGENYAVANDVPFVRFPPLWETESRAAGFNRNQIMAWYATHLVVFQKNESRGTQSMIDLAEREELASWVIPV